jgi:hypothetical protein
MNTAILKVQCCQAEGAGTGARAPEIGALELVATNAPWIGKLQDSVEPPSRSDTSVKRMKSEFENDISLTLLKILAASLGNAAEPKCRDQ